MKPLIEALLIECHDSFSMNVLGALQELLPDMECLSVDSRDIMGRDPDLLVLGPGPGAPSHYPILSELLARRLNRPTLGICLGFQAMAMASGGRLLTGRPVHGYPEPIRHDRSSLFRGIPSPFLGMRYHSLSVEATSSEIDPCAWAEDGTMMAARFLGRPWFGVQFHPESVGSQFGDRLLLSVLEQWRLIEVPMSSSTEPGI